MRLSLPIMFLLLLLPAAGSESRVKVFVGKIEKSDTGKPDQKYRLLLVRELAKLKSVETVDDRAAADYILSGAGRASGGGREWQESEDESEGPQSESGRDQRGSAGDGDPREQTDRQAMDYTDRTAELSVTVEAPGRGIILTCRKSVTRSAEFSWSPEEAVVKQVVKHINKQLKWK